MMCTNYGGLYYAASFFPLTRGSLLQESQSVCFTCDGRSKFKRLTKVKVTVLWIFVFISIGIITKLILTFAEKILFSSRQVFVRVRAKTNLV
jgi:hypothetical protein